MNFKVFLTLMLGLLLNGSVFAATESTNDLAKKRIAKLESTVMNPNLPLEKRIRALRKLYAGDFKSGKIERTFCVWDPLGRAGPISSTVNDQKLRSMH